MSRGNYNRNNNGYNNNGYNNNNYNNGYNQNNNRNGNQGKPKKHSGCKAGTDKNGNQYVQGWKYDKQNGLRKFFAAPYSKTQEVTSKTSGKTWQNWFVQVTLPSGEVVKTSGMFDVATKKVTIQQFGFVMNPRGGAGGYVGPFFYKKN